MRQRPAKDWPELISDLEDQVIEQKAEIERLRVALKPFAGVVYNDNGDVTYDYSSVSREHYWAAYQALKHNPII
jgi:hypothetical protein